MHSFGPSDNWLEAIAEEQRQADAEKRLPDFSVAGNAFGFPLSPLGDDTTPITTGGLPPAITAIIKDEASGAYKKAMKYTMELYRLRRRRDMLFRFGIAACLMEVLLLKMHHGWYGGCAFAIAGWLFVYWCFTCYRIRCIRRGAGAL